MVHQFVHSSWTPLYPLREAITEFKIPDTKCSEEHSTDSKTAKDKKSWTKLSQRWDYTWTEVESEFVEYTSYNECSLHQFQPVPSKLKVKITVNHVYTTLAEKLNINL